MGPRRVPHIALVGHPGVGKTTVATAVLRQLEEKSMFKKIVRLYGISRDPNNKVLCQKVWTQVHYGKKFPDWLTLTFDPQEARRKLSDHLPNGTLLFLDDIWAGDAYRNLCFRSAEKRDSRVLVTSRQNHLLMEAGLPPQECKAFIVPALDLGPGRSLLCRQAFPSSTVPTEAAWVTLIDRVVARCEHLPLALTVCHSTYR